MSAEAIINGLKDQLIAFGEMKPSDSIWVIRISGRTYDPSEMTTTNWLEPAVMSESRAKKFAPFISNGRGIRGEAMTLAEHIRQSSEELRKVIKLLEERS